MVKIIYYLHDLEVQQKPAKLQCYNYTQRSKSGTNDASFVDILCAI